MPEAVPDSVVDAELRAAARAFLARHRADVDLAAEWIALQEHVERDESMNAQLVGSRTRWFGAAAAVVLAIVGVTAIALTRRDHGELVPPAPPTVADPITPTVPASPAPTPITEYTPVSAPVTSPSTAPPPATDAPAVTTSAAPISPPSSCWSELVAPPALIDGSPPGEPTVDPTADGVGRIATWGSPGSPIAISQLLDVEHDAAWIGALGAHVRDGIRTAASQSGNPATDPSHIVTYEPATGCVRSYLIGPGYEYREVDLLAEWWADAIELGIPWPTGGTRELDETTYFTQDWPNSPNPDVTTREFASDGRILRVVPDDEVDADQQPPTLPDGRVLSFSYASSYCAGAPITVATTTEPLHPELTHIRSFALGDDGTLLATRNVCPTGEAIFPDDAHTELLRFDPTSGAVTLVHTRTPPEDSGYSEYRAAAVAPDGRHFAMTDVYTTESARWEVHRSDSTGEPIDLASACPIPGDIAATPVFVSSDLVVVARLCVDPAERDTGWWGNGSGPVRVEVVSLDDNRLVWSNTTDWFGVNSYSSTVDLSARLVDGEVVAIVSGAADVEAPVRAVFMSSSAAVEVTRLGHDAYAFHLSEFIDPFATPAT